MKHLSACNIAIVIALGCFTYILVQSHYERQATEELYKSIKQLNEQATNAAQQATAILGQIQPAAEPEEVEIVEPIAPVVAKAARVKRQPKRRIKPDPCEEVVNTTTFGRYEVRYKDLKCLLQEQ